MFIPHLRLICLTFVLSSLFATTSFAEIYKWIDKDGQINYSQQAPQGVTATIIKAPPPPAIDPNAAQQKIDQLITQQESDEQMRLEQQNQQKVEAKNELIQQQNCTIAQQQLEQYQNNPGRRLIDADGNATRITEEERQKKIEELQKNVTEYCQ
ncbi:hypothetical protein LCGC14_1169020 [marine sediment metagenome]|uniref:DUF4124 domain-containing protein n=1 Tax=marine sediment metagenome TaxID=412755 RepID=A0A0F9LQI3_9ZZZZ|nr:DUF4124 domain-containing protein [Methylophaga sp.]HEC58312.1 DUF4124 domain-containing protein [Methylophaga sp.]